MKLYNVSLEMSTNRDSEANKSHIIACLKQFYQKSPCQYFKKFLQSNKVTYTYWSVLCICSELLRMRRTQIWFSNCFIWNYELSLIIKLNAPFGTLFSMNTFSKNEWKWHRKQKPKKIFHSHGFKCEHCYNKTVKFEKKTAENMKLKQNRYIHSHTRKLELCRARRENGKVKR